MAHTPILQRVKHLYHIENPWAVDITILATNATLLFIIYSIFAGKLIYSAASLLPVAAEWRVILAAIAMPLFSIPISYLMVRLFRKLR